VRGRPDQVNFEPGAVQLICAARIELGAIDHRVRLRFLS
jgi:hypothetical protein